MKLNFFIKLISGLLLVLILVGCAGGKGKPIHYEGNFSKNGDITLEPLDNILDQGVLFPVVQNIQELYGQNEFVLYFPIRDTNDIFDAGYNIGDIYLQTCENTILDDNNSLNFLMDDYYLSKEFIEYRDYDVYFVISKLKALNIVSLNPEKQTDICLLLYAIGGNVISNKLVYTAEEINAAMAEYEQFKAKEE